MFIAMNRFSIKLDRESEFVAIWKTREGYLDDVTGFESFNLLRGPVTNGVVLYATHTVWVDEKAFSEWVGGDGFRKAHQGPRPDPEMFAAPSVLEKFTSVL